MKKTLMHLFLLSIGNITASIIFYIVTHSVYIAIGAFTALMVLVMIKPLLLVMNILTKRTNWYRNKTEVATKFSKRFPLQLDICSFGSTSGKFAFNFDDVGLKGENWAVSPQTLSYDFRLLKYYSSYLKEGAYVLFTLCPFSGCVKDFDDDSYNYKYYTFLHPILIPHFSQKTKLRIMDFVNKPFQTSPLLSLKRILRDIPIVNNKIMNDKEMDSDATYLINSWKKEFSISCLDAPVSAKNTESMSYNTSLLKEIISFCGERNLKPVIVIPPISRLLSSKLSEVFRENYIYSLFNSAIDDNVLFLNYLDDKRISDLSLFSNSYLLNSNGGKAFTRIVMKDLKLV